MQTFPDRHAFELMPPSGFQVNWGRHVLLTLLLLPISIGHSYAGMATREPQSMRSTVCQLIEHAAAANRLPVAYLSRLLWTESRFSSSVTSAAGAQGIAQFMPETASEQGLSDPWDPASAIPHAARLLVDLDQRFGNLGLAAAAYNAGPGRLAGWLQGASGIPLETRRYVQLVTGRPLDEWVESDRAAASERMKQSCAASIAELSRVGTRLSVSGDLWYRLPFAIHAGRNGDLDLV